MKQCGPPSCCSVLLKGGRASAERSQALTACAKHMFSLILDCPLPPLPLLDPVEILRVPPTLMSPIQTHSTHTHVQGLQNVNSLAQPLDALPNGGGPTNATDNATANNATGSSAVVLVPNPSYLVGSSVIYSMDSGVGVTGDATSAPVTIDGKSERERPFVTYKYWQCILLGLLSTHILSPLL